MGLLYKHKSYSQAYETIRDMGAVRTRVGA